MSIFHLFPSDCITLKYYDNRQFGSVLVRVPEEDREGDCGPTYAPPRHIHRTQVQGDQLNVAVFSGILYKLTPRHCTNGQVTYSKVPEKKHSIHIGS